VKKKPGRSIRAKGSPARAKTAGHGRAPNHLAGEKSPYLVQHADNPVDWYAWGPEAFEKARKEDKPVFLSIGYSTCHWCHVMAEESFEDPEVAGLLNDVFVCIKVDREERPDIDTIYMSVCQLITGSGGWPLSIVLTPDGKPFFAATYIPKYSRLGSIGLMDLASRIKQLWETKHAEMVASADQITDVLRRGIPAGSPEDLGADVLDMAYEQLRASYDREYAGFGEAMKFPAPHNLQFLLRYWKRTGKNEALRMVEETLRAMRRGGIYDHLGFGLHRYATDREWRVPHFEKMLYDQAMAGMAYVEAFQATGNEEYGDTAREIYAYVLQKLTAPAGGFYCAQDADSEGEEGKFYVWTRAEMERSLGKGKAEFAARVFDVRPEGNFVEHVTGRKTERNILHLARTAGELATEMNLSEAMVRKQIEEAREKLLLAREKRPPPAVDDKILTDWNGLMIASLAKAGRALGDSNCTKAAERAFSFIRGHLGTPEGRLLHRFRDGQVSVPGNLNDYALLSWGAIELYETTFRPEYLEAAISLSDQVLKRFWDVGQGGFFLTPDDTTDLVVRPKDYYDGAVPSGNSVSILNFLRLDHLIGQHRFEEKARQAERSVAGIVRKAPTAYTQLLLAVDFAVGPTHEVVVAGNTKKEDTRKMIGTLQSKFLPNAVVVVRPMEQKSPGIDRIAEYVKNYRTLDHRATAYVCRDFSCRPPTTDIGEMMEILEAGK
jgi:uncharacterized protein